MKNPAIIFGSRMLKAMGNEKRLEILYHLFETELKVGDLENWSDYLSRRCHSTWQFCVPKILSKPAALPKRFLFNPQ